MTNNNQAGLLQPTSYSLGREKYDYKWKMSSLSELEECMPELKAVNNFSITGSEETDN